MRSFTYLPCWNGIKLKQDNGTLSQENMNTNYTPVGLEELRQVKQFDSYNEQKKWLFEKCKIADQFTFAEYLSIKGFFRRDIKNMQKTVGHEWFNPNTQWTVHDRVILDYGSVSRFLFENWKFVEAHGGI